MTVLVMDQTISSHKTLKYHMKTEFSTDLSKILNNTFESGIKTTIRSKNLPTKELYRLKHKSLTT